MSTVEDNVAEEIRRENAGRNEEPAKAEPAAEKAAEKDSGVPKKKNPCICSASAEFRK